MRSCPASVRTLNDVALEMEAQVDGSRAAERLREGFEVALIGPPNAGKSTLLNRLAGRDAALTSDVPGTTRDVIEVRLDVGGLPVTFLDMAGLRKTIRCRWRRLASPVPGSGPRRRTSGCFCSTALSTSAASRLDCLPGDVVVRAKSDIVDAGPGMSSVRTHRRRYRRSPGFDSSRNWKVASRRLRSRHMVGTGSRSRRRPSHCGPPRSMCEKKAERSNSPPLKS